MKTAISLPADLFREADKLARKLKLSRSELYRLAIQKLLQEERDAAITEQINRVCAEVDTSLDEFGRRAAYEGFRRLDEEEKNEARRGLVGKPAGTRRVRTGLSSSRRRRVDESLQRERAADR